MLDTYYLIIIIKLKYYMRKQQRGIWIIMKTVLKIIQLFLHHISCGNHVRDTCPWLSDTRAYPIGADSHKPQIISATDGSRASQLTSQLYFCHIYTYCTLSGVVLIESTMTTLSLLSYRTALYQASSLTLPSLYIKNET